MFGVTAISGVTGFTSPLELPYNFHVLNEFCVFLSGVFELFDVNHPVLQMPSGSYHFFRLLSKVWLLWNSFFLHTKTYRYRKSFSYLDCAFKPLVTVGNVCHSSEGLRVSST